MGDVGVLGAFEELVLLAMVHLGAEGYGMALRREIAARSGRDVSIGAVYATLSRMESKGYLESVLDDDGGARPRRTYRLLPEGREALARTGEVRARMWDGVELSALGEGRGS
jgi:PadR family transcriptional regulator PadR